MPSVPPSPHPSGTLEGRYDACPNIHKIVHNDLLNNLLVAPDNGIGALFDWGDSLAGDPLYDVSWLCIGTRWYPGIEPAHVMALTRTRFPHEPDLEARLDCYALHLGLDSLQYLAYAGLKDELDSSMRWVKEMLNRFGQT